jgi:hypothetical protein
VSDLSKIAANIARFRQAVFRHDEINPTHNSHGIGMAQFDMDRLGFEEGEELWSGYTIHADGKGTGNFRVLCDGEHDGERQAEVETEVTRAVGVEVGA